MQVSYTSLANVELYFCTNPVYSLSTACVTVELHLYTVLESWNVMHFYIHAFFWNSVKVSAKAENRGVE